jgi:hypothetical protein
MRMLLRHGAGLMLALCLLLVAPAQAEAPAPHALPPVLETAGVPGLGPNGQLELSRTLLRNLPRVFVIGPGGAFASRSGPAPVEELERAALEACQAFARNNAPCIPWLRDLDIAWPGREWQAPRPPQDMAFGDARRVTLPDPRFLWWGPERARGVLLWAHGRSSDGVDSRGNQPQIWVRQFNNAGWDVWRFDRDPATDFTRPAAAWLREDLAALRRRGYRHVVMAGQSRGGWNTLMVLDTPGLADVHIAIAPAAHGDRSSGNRGRQIDELTALVAAAAGAARARVAVANFRDDDFDANPDRRGTLFRELGAKSGAFLFIDRPERPTGHGGGGTAAFNDRFGGCLFRFATEARPPREC